MTKDIAKAVAELRIGIFNIDEAGLDKDPAQVLAMLDGVIVTHCSHDEVKRLFVYGGYHPGFDPLHSSSPAAAIPHYTALFDGPVRTWRRVSPPSLVAGGRA